MAQTNKPVPISVNASVACPVWTITARRAVASPITDAVTGGAFRIQLGARSVD